MNKDFWKSKTLWFGVLSIVIGVAGLFGFGDFVPDSNIVEYGEILNGIVVIILRLLTKEPVI